MPTPPQDMIIVSVPPELIQAISSIYTGEQTLAQLLQTIATNGIPIQVNVEFPQGLLDSVAEIATRAGEIRDGIAALPDREVDVTLGLNGSIIGSEID